MEIKELVPSLELCKLIPQGEFADSAFIWDKTTSIGFWDGEDKDGNQIGGFGKITHTKYRLRQNYSERCRKHIKDQDITPDVFPAPTTDEILDKCKDITGVLNPTLWYQHEWIADCGFDRTGKLSEEFFEDADFKNIDIIEGRSNKNPATAALKLWLKLSDQSC